MNYEQLDKLKETDPVPGSKWRSDYLKKLNRERYENALYEALWFYLEEEIDKHTKVVYPGAVYNNYLLIRDNPALSYDEFKEMFMKNGDVVLNGLEYSGNDNWIFTPGGECLIRNMNGLKYEL